MTHSEKCDAVARQCPSLFYVWFSAQEQRLREALRWQWIDQVERGRDLTLREYCTEIGIWKGGEK